LSCLNNQVTPSIPLPEKIYQDLLIKFLVNFAAYHSCSNILYNNISHSMITIQCSHFSIQDIVQILYHSQKRGILLQIILKFIIVNFYNFSIKLQNTNKPRIYNGAYSSCYYTIISILYVRYNHFCLTM